MRPGRRPRKDPIEQEARSELRESSVRPPPGPKPTVSKPRQERKPERWR